VNKNKIGIETEVKKSKIEAEGELKIRLKCQGN